VSEAVSVQLIPQRVVFLGQQNPALQYWSEGQALPHPPQLRASEAVSTSHPSAYIPLQLAVPLAHSVRHTAVTIPVGIPQRWAELGATPQ
jgi:hypothetical protein